MEKMKKEHVQRIVIGLVVVALILGFFAYKKKYPDSFKAMTSQVNSNSKVGNLTDEQKVLRVPGPYATQDEIIAHSKLAGKLAVVGSMVVITECKATPLVLQVRINTKVTMKNNGQLSEAITFDSKNKITIMGGQTLDVTATFAHGLGLYGYRCSTDKVNEIAGFILVAP